MKKLPRLLRPPRGKKALARAIILFVAIVLTGDYWLYPVYTHASEDPEHGGSNGLWIRYDWYFGKHDRYAVTALRDRMYDASMRDAFFHVRGIEPSGALKYRYPTQARELTSRLRDIAPRLRKIAWVYVGSHKVQLSNATVRAKMVSEARWLVEVCGFDGVQWDYEPCPDGDPSFLSLLTETRAAMPKGSFLSTAVPCCYPFPFTRFGWSEPYYRDVAHRCDQMAVMAYDTGVYFPRAYVSLVRFQMERVTRAASGTPCKVLIGLPTYEEGLRSHNPRAENLALGLTAVRSAFREDNGAFQGVAVFADYTTDEDEWDTFQKLWVPQIVSDYPRPPASAGVAKERHAAPKPK